MHYTGVDILLFDRLRPLDGQWHDPFFRKTFTQSERQHCQAHHDPLLAYGGLFSAKEAVFKALPLHPDEVRLQQIEILHDSDGRPLVRLLPPLDRLAVERGITHVSLSLSYEKNMAIAFALAE